MAQGYSLINEASGQTGVERGGAIINVGAVLAVLLGLPAMFIGMFGAAGVITGQKLVAGTLGALWGYCAAAGTYELNRRKFDWSRGRRFADVNLLAGSFAVSTGLMVSGALHETMPILAIVPALSAIKQASDGHDTRLLSYVHAAVLLTGFGVGAWFYRDGIVGSVLLERIAALP